MLLQIHPEHAEPHKIRRATEVLRKGGIVAYPTDTIYALGCDILNKRAVERIYQLRNIPKKQPLTILCASLSEAAHYALVDDNAFRVLRRVLPGPYCCILPASPRVPKVFVSKRRTVGIRVPNHPVPQALLAELGHPIVSSSAALAGTAFDDPEDIDERFRGLDLVLDAGLGGTVPSTVVDLTSDELEVVREGAGPIDPFL